MKRKDFLYLTGMGISASMLSRFTAAGSPIVPGTRMRDVDVAIKKRMSDVALNAARSKGATYTDVRLGRYLNEFVVTRDKNIENIVDTESYGMGIRVIANGCWGFAATDKLDDDSIARAAQTAVAIAKENSRIQTEPVQLAPQKGYGEVSWKTPIERNAFEVPMKEKTDLLLSVNDAAFKNGANYVNSVLFLVNEQKYFASTDGSYIDQDIHRIWPTFGVTRIDDKSGKFETRSSLSAPRGMGYEYLMPRDSDKIHSKTTLYRDRYDMLEDAGAAALQAAEKLKAKNG